MCKLPHHLCHFQDAPLGSEKSAVHINGCNCILILWHDGVISLARDSSFWLFPETSNFLLAEKEMTVCKNMCNIFTPATWQLVQKLPVGPTHSSVTLNSESLVDCICKTEAEVTIFKIKLAFLSHHDGQFCCSNITRCWTTMNY